MTKKFFLPETLKNLALFKTNIEKSYFPIYIIIVDKRIMC